MKILHIHWNPCARAFKAANVAAGIHELSLAKMKGDEGPPFTEVTTFDYHNPRTVLPAIEHANPDIIHSHNTPDIFTVEALRYGAPVVHDVHDFLTFQVDPRNAQQFPYDVFEVEQKAQEEADAVVYATPTLAAWGNALYAPRKSLLFESRVSLEKYVRPRDPDGPLSIVYQGGISLSGADSGRPYRKYGLLFQLLTELSFRMGIYPAPACVNTVPDFSRHPKVRVHEPLPYDDLLPAMARFHYSFVGFNFDGCNRRLRRYCHAALPNKFFDSMAAGVPVIVHNAKLVGDLVEEHGIGIVWDGVSDIHEEAMDRWQELRAVVLQKREMFAMERQSQKLLDLYEELV